MVNLTEEQKKYLIVLLLLVIISVQLSILHQQRMSMTMIALNLTERNVIPKIENFFEVIVPRMVPRHFRRYFRMYDDTLNSIISYLSSREPFTSMLDKGRVCRTKKVAMTCAYLGSKQTIMQLAQLFGVSEDTFLRCTDVVMDALVGNLHQIIRWPKPSEFEEIASEFDKVGRFFPNVIGAIDGLHLEIELTEERRFEPSFINYKQFHSVHLQAVATHDLRFLHVFAGWPGRSADGSVLKHSPLSKTLPQLMNNNSEYLTDTYHIVGDKAFPLTRHILTPYRKSQRRSRTMAQKIYNKHLASKRQNIERAFAVLMKRFPRLQLLNQKTTKKKVKVILAACGLHNICIMENDNVEFYIRKASQENVTQHAPVGDINDENFVNTDAGNIKRILVTNEIFSHYLRYGN